MTTTGRSEEPQPQGRRQLLFLFGLVLAILAAGYATQARLGALAHWRADPVAYFFGGTPVMTSADAYYALRLAKARHEGTFIEHADDPLRHYQRLQRSRETSEYFGSDTTADWQPQRAPRRMPLLPELIARLIPVAGSAELAGLYLTPVLASLFVIPLFLYAWRLGEPEAGLFAALIGAFAPLYVVRTQLGYVDTDCLNLFFPWLASLLVFSLGPSARTVRVLWTSAALGVVLYLYFRWYEKAAISALYWGTLLLWLALQRRGLREVVLAVLICVVCSHPVQFAQCADSASGLLGRYLGGRTTADGASLVDAMFPNVMETVSEQRGPKGVAALPSVLGHALPGALGLLGFAVLAARRWRECLPLAPIAVMGAFTFLSGSRFAMYLAPLAGLGLGYAIVAGVRGIAARVMPDRDASRGDRAGSHATVLRALLPYGVVTAVFFLGLQPTMARTVTRSAPVITAPDLAAVHRAARRMPPGARVWTWWDRGFAYAHVAGWAVYHDGSAQYTPQTHVIAHSFLTDSPNVLHAAMARVDRIGNAGITAFAQRVQDRAGLLDALSAPDETSAPPVEQFVVFSRDMLRSAAALRHVAGLPIVTTRGTPATFQALPCTAFRDSRLECGRASVDLVAGRLADGGTIRRLDIVDGGAVTKRVDYPNESERVLEIVIGPDRAIEVYLLPDELYRSNLNRMFVLGEYDRALFEEVMSEVPRLRVFRRVPTAAASRRG